MGKGKILIVEDDENLRMALEDNLVDEDYDVITAHNGKDALALLARSEVDVVILDIMLPDMDGYQICREIRQKRLPLRVLMLTARTLESDLVAGFDAGADDYLSKPYRLRELLARVRALMRRKNDRFRKDLNFGPIQLSLAKRTVYKAGEPVALTTTQYKIVEYLCLRAGQLVSRSELLDAANFSEDGLSNALEVHIFNIRRLLGKTFVQNRRGLGYIVQDG